MLEGCPNFHRMIDFESGKNIALINVNTLIISIPGMIMKLMYLKKSTENGGF